MPWPAMMTHIASAATVAAMCVAGVAARMRRQSNATPRRTSQTSASAAGHASTRQHIQIHVVGVDTAIPFARPV